MRPDQKIPSMITGPIVCTLLWATFAIAQKIDETEPMTIMIKPGPPPSGHVVVSVDDVSADEGADALVFPVALSEIGEQAVTLTYRLIAETALADSDYEAAAGTLTIPPGSQSAEIPVTILDDTVNEGDETFIVELTDITNAEFERSQAIGTILDNDALPELSIDHATATELSQKIVFTLTLSAASGRDVSVDFRTQDETALAENDYTARKGTLTVPAGTTTAMLEVVITLDENRKEDDETFLVELMNPQNATIQTQYGVGTIRNTAGSFVNRALGHPLPEPSTIVLVAVGLLGIGLLTQRKSR
jgi:hypothetical protein